jgi:LPS export ABC transporter permease LptF/LPS export ABC transporter permease LptG
MNRFSWLISKYLAKAVLPYLIFSWLLLSVILFVQQGSRFSEIFFNANIPKNLIWQLTLALIPNVVAFTCPMAILIGVIIGLSRMNGDSELTAIRAAGIGNFQITVPILFLGITLSVFTFFVNLNGVPLAAQIVRKVAIQTAIYKLESPIEPGVFNTEISGYTIYVKDGDIENGTWKNIFVYYEDATKSQSRLITSKEGRIDSQNQISELLLENAVIISISSESNKQKFISENVGEVRLSLKTERGELINKLTNTAQSPEELGLNELLVLTQTKTGKEKIEAELIWQRRIILSLNPVIFALLGLSLSLKFTRGGRGFGIFLALLSLLVHYLLTLLGEQLARTNQISVLTAGLMPVFTSFFFIFWFFLSKRILPRNFFSNLRNKVVFEIPSIQNKSNFYLNFRTGILDLDIIFNLFKYFFLTFVFLTFVYLIFTAFELWKFAGEINNGFLLLLKYLFYLLPFIYIQLAPSALMIATLATFVIKSRQNEIVTWTSAGQSVYRLLLPCFLLMILIGFVNWQIQEKILPGSNQTQDQLRSQIRNRGVLAKKAGKFWMTNGNRIFSFDSFKNQTGDIQNIENLTIYEFTEDQSKLQTIYKTPTAVWEKDKIRFSDNAAESVWLNGKVQTSAIPNFVMTQLVNPIAVQYDKPSHLNTAETKLLIENNDSDSETRSYKIALQKKYTIPFLPFVITLFTAPFALSLSRKGRVVTIGYAVGMWLLFIGINSVFEQFGLNNFISPDMAIWSPIVLFSILGVFLLSKIKT